MNTFGLIVEGQTDYAVLKNILYGFARDPDVVFNELQPLRDATDVQTMRNFGGWYNVFEYCRSEDFREVLQETDDFIVIQIDTDRSEEPNYDVSKTDTDNQPLPLTRLVANVRQRFIQIFNEQFGEAFFTENSQRILFAITVDATECWLLPLLYDDTNQGATNNCFYRMNQKRLKQGLKKIREDKVGEKANYADISKPYRKFKVLSDKQKLNPSLKIFFDELTEKVKITENTEGV